jgi:Uma2 family endonuclease
MRVRVGDYVEDYFAMGVIRVWIIDPAHRTAVLYQPGGVSNTRNDGLLQFAGTPIALDLIEVFRSLDQD